MPNAVSRMRSPLYPRRACGGEWAKPKTCRACETASNRQCPETWARQVSYLLEDVEQGHERRVQHLEETLGLPCARFEEKRGRTTSDETESHAVVLCSAL
jgi:hypothetical protein